MYLKSLEEIELVRESAMLVSKTLGMIASAIEPGVTPLALDHLAEEYIRSHGGIPAFKGLYGFPNTLCTSINHYVVHGIPNDTPLEEGDIISIDCGVLKNQFYGDHAYTFEVGEVAPEIRKLLQVTLKSLYIGIEQAVYGNRIGHIGHAIQTYVEKHRYSVVREYVGHGLGRKMHEDPQIPNFGRARSGPPIENGMVLAIEPMVNMGTKRVKKLEDNWSIVTADGLPSAHFEHNIAVVDGKPQILSTFEFVDAALKDRRHQPSSSDSEQSLVGQIK